MNQSESPDKTYWCGAHLPWQHILSWCEFTLTTHHWAGARPHWQHHCPDARPWQHNTQSRRARPSCQHILSRCASILTTHTELGAHSWNTSTLRQWIRWHPLWQHIHELVRVHLDNNTELMSVHPNRTRMYFTVQIFKRDKWYCRLYSIQEKIRFWDVRDSKGRDARTKSASYVKFPQWIGPTTLQFHLGIVQSSTLLWYFCQHDEGIETLFQNTPTYGQISDDMSCFLDIDSFLTFWSVFKPAIFQFFGGFILKWTVNFVDCETQKRRWR